MPTKYYIQDLRMKAVGSIINSLPISMSFKQLFVKKWGEIERNWVRFCNDIKRVGNLTLYRIKGLFIKGKCKKCIYYFKGSGCCEPTVPDEDMKENDYCQDFNYGIVFRMPNDFTEQFEDF